MVSIGTWEEGGGGGIYLEIVFKLAKKIANS